jgi:hypothetical protein
LNDFLAAQLKDARQYDRIAVFFSIFGAEARI